MPWRVVKTSVTALINGEDRNDREVSLVLGLGWATVYAVSLSHHWL